MNGVFEGGGVKAIGLVGAVEAAEKRGFRFHQTAGTSSGSIVASLIASGYTATEMKAIISQTSFTSFLKKSWLHQVRFVGPAIRLFVKKGLYSGNALEYWIKNLLLLKGVRTFGDLPIGKLRIIASDITRGRLLVLPDDISQYGIDPKRLEVAKAIRMSTSIPYFFDPVILRRPLSGSRTRPPTDFSQQFIYIVDGGLLSNFPLWVFDRSDMETPTIGFQYVGRNEGRGTPIRGPLTMFHALFSTMLEAHDERYIEEHNSFRTIKIPSQGIHTTQFDLTPEQSARMYEAGLRAGNRFFDKWSYDQYQETFQKIVRPRLLQA